MNAPAPRRRSATVLVALAVCGVLLCAGFAALGLWQVERLGWKQALIAQIGRELQAEPAPAPGPDAWGGLERERDEYRRLRLQGRFADDRQVLVRASTELGAGFWVLTPLRMPDGWWLLVNRGFVPPGQRDRIPPGAEAQGLVGLLRFSEPGGSLLQGNQPQQGRWYSRDVAAIAAAQGLQGPVAPYFVDLQAAPGATEWPRAGLTVLRFSNNHLMYAITWFALAAMVAAAVGYVAFDERRLRRGAEADGPR